MDVIRVFLLDQPPAMIPPVKLGLLALALAGWPLELEDDTRGSIPRLALSTLTEQADVLCNIQFSTLRDQNILKCTNMSDSGLPRTCCLKVLTS
jgi:hypothetical protein